MNELRTNLSEMKGQLETTKTAIQKMTAAFDGTKIIADANAAVKAVADIGGATALTEAEQRRLNATVTEALAKYEALGQEAPAELKKIADQTKDAGQKTQTWTEQTKGLGAALGIAFSIQSVVNFGKSLLDLGDQIVRVADQTGLTTEEVQRLQYVADQSGNTLDDLTGAVSRMQKGLVSGDAGAVAALKSMNLSFDDLKKLGPYEQMAAIADGISKIENPANQAQAAIAIFGKAGASILPTLKAGFRDLGNEAPVMSDKTTRALDAAGDSLNRFKHAAQVWAAEAYNFLGKAFDLGLAAVYRYIAGFMESIEKLYGALQKIPGAAKVFPGLAEEMKRAGDAAIWFKDAANQATIHAEEVAPAIRKAIPPIQELEKETTKSGAALREHARASKEAENGIDALTKKVVWGGQGITDLGFRIGLAIPQMDALAVASADLQKRIKLGMDGLGELGFKVESGFKEAAKVARTQTQSLAGMITSEFSRILSSGGGIVDALKQFGTNTAKEFTASVLSFIPGIGPALSALAGPLVDGVKKLFGGIFGTAGRDAIKDFAATFAGGFDGPGGLHEALLAIGAEGEQMWIRLTQQVGRNDQEGARAAIAAATALLQKHKDEIAATAATQEQAATQIAASNQAAIDSTKKAIGDLDQQISSLNQSIANEAPEEEMGIIERNTRAQIASLQEQRDAASKTLESLTTQASTSMQNVANAIDKLPDEVALRFKAEIELQLKQMGAGAAPMAAGGDFIVTRPTLFLAGEAGPERATFSGAGNLSHPAPSVDAQLLQDVRRMLRDQPRALAVAIHDAIVLAGAR